MYVYLTNIYSADDYTTGYMPSNAMVHSDGNIFWSPPSRLRSSCKVDITFFPFDEQVCPLKFGSWTYDQAQVSNISDNNYYYITYCNPPPPIHFLYYFVIKER